MQQLFIQFINYVWLLVHVSALHCDPQGAFLAPSERCLIEEQSIEYCVHNPPHLDSRLKNEYSVVTPVIPFWAFMVCSKVNC
jgi:hypothetical protein